MNRRSYIKKMGIAYLAAMASTATGKNNLQKLAGSHIAPKADKVVLLWMAGGAI